MRYSNEAILTNGSMTQSFNSYGFDTQQMLGFSVQAVWTASVGSVTGTGTLKLQSSNDLSHIPGNVQATGIDPATNVSRWDDIANSSQPVLLSTSGSSSFTWNYPIFQGRWVRMVFTTTSGSGVMSAYYMSKGG